MSAAFRRFAVLSRLGTSDSGSNSGSGGTLATASFAVGSGLNEIDHVDSHGLGHMTDYLPTASLQMLRHRAALLATIRRFFDEAGYFEVETPLLSADIVVDAWLEPFVTEFLSLSHKWARGGQLRYLQTSPEFAMKRLLVAGATAIYQLGKVFRNGEVGQRHNPEFTMLEWYRVGDDHHAQMRYTEALVRCVFAKAGTLTAGESTSEVHARHPHVWPGEWPTRGDLNV